MLKSLSKRSNIVKNLSIVNSERMISGKHSLNMENGMNTPVHFTVQDTARIVTLNRPQKLNAINTEMSDLIFNTLNEYSISDATNLVILNSSNQPRAFCSGGDVATVATNNMNKKINDSINFFESEYSLNFQMATYNKPIVSIMDGITMGGGVGLSIHTPFRIATQNTKWAMPEMDIGFFPDVGVTFALPRIINFSNEFSQMAAYLCLTGDVVGGEDAYMLGLASHYVSNENVDSLQKRLGELSLNENNNSSKINAFKKVNDAIEEFSTELPNDYKFKFSEQQLHLIEKVFKIDSETTIEKILQTLDNINNPEQTKFAKEIKDKLLLKSTTSLQVAIRLLQENSKDNISSALKRDLFTAANFCNESVNSNSPVEFTQSVKHKLVDKIKTNYAWKQTKVLAPVQISSLVSPKPSILTSLRRNRENVTWNDYPYHSKFQLPSESMVIDYIKKVNEINRAGEINSNNNITKRDVITYFSNFNENSKGKNSIDRIITLICHKNFNVNDFNCLIQKSTD